MGLSQSQVKRKKGAAFQKKYKAFCFLCDFSESIFLAVVAKGAYYLVTSTVKSAINWPFLLGALVFHVGSVAVAAVTYGPTAAFLTFICFAALWVFERKGFVYYGRTPPPKKPPKLKNLTAIELSEEGLRAQRDFDYERAADAFRLAAEKGDGYAPKNLLKLQALLDKPSVPSGRASESDPR